MLKMRLQRTGRKHDPSFRIIVQEHTRGPKAGKHVDLLGNYDVKKGNVTIDGDKAKLWLSRGVQVSGTVWNLLISNGIVEGKKVNVLPKKTVPEKQEEEKAEAPKSEEGTGESTVSPETATEAIAEETPKVPEEAPTEPTPEETPAQPKPEEPAAAAPEEESK